MNTVTFLRVLFVSLFVSGCSSALVTPDTAREVPRGGPVVHVELESPPAEGQLVGVYQVVAVTGALDEKRVARVEDPRYQDSLRLAAQHETVGSFACSAPCDQRMPFPIERELFIGGPGLASSSNFTIEQGRREPVVVQVKPGSKRQFDGGIALLTVGSVSTLAGVGVAPAPGSTAHAVAGTLIGAGVVVLAAGIPVLLTGKVRLSFPNGGVSF
jgi:hypothetical protein